MLDSNTYDYDPEIVAKIHAIFDAATQVRSRNFFLRVDLRLPDIGYTYQENELFSECMRVFTQNRTRIYGKVFYLAVRERVEPSPHCHYHVFMLFDGNATRSPYDHIQKLQKLWNSMVGLPVEWPGLIHYGRAVKYWWQYPWPRPQMCHGVRLFRNSPEFDAYLRYCLAQSLYLAKTYSKETHLAGAHRVFSTKLGHLGRSQPSVPGNSLLDDNREFAFGSDDEM